MTIALVAALCIGQFLTALVIAFFVLFAEMVEGYTVGGGRRAIQNLIEALPRQVRVRRGGEERELGTNEVAAGETIIIRPGERIPADGVVSKGHSFVDQSSITGESLPVEKVEESKVFAGTINKDGVLEVIVEKIGRDTTFGKIIEIVEQAEKSRAPVQRDRRSARGGTGLLRVRRGSAHAHRHTQFHFDYCGDHRRWRVRRGSRNAAGNPGGHRQRCASRHHH